MKIHGHEDNLEALRAAARQGHLAHCYLFHGMEGIGKKTTALELARSFVCPVSAPVACGECVSCRKALTGNHPDIFVFAPAAPSIKIDDVRLLQEKALLHPFESRWKIFIVDAVEKLTREAANAFLKTLEEPPDSSIFFLITSQHQALLPTVLSRCQKVAFRPLTTTQLTAILLEVDGCEATTAQTTAILAGGSVAVARELLQDNFLPRRASLFRALQGLITNKEMGVFRLVKNLGSEKEEVVKNLGVIKSAFRDAALLALRHDAKTIINKDFGEILAALARQFTAHDCITACRIVDRTLRALNFNANRPLLLEAMGYRLVGLMR